MARNCSPQSWPSAYQQLYQAHVQQQHWLQQVLMEVLAVAAALSWRQQRCRLLDYSGLLWTCTAH